MSRTTDRCHFGFPLPALRLFVVLLEVFGFLVVGLGVSLARAAPRIQSRQLRAELLKARCCHRLSIHRVARGTGRALGLVQHEKHFDGVQVIVLYLKETTLSLQLRSF